LVGKRPVVVHAGKIGRVYVLDRATGRLLRRSRPFVPQQNLFARPTPEGVIVAPGANGGSSWSPMAYSPRTGLTYVVGLHQPMRIRSESAGRIPGRPWYGGDAQPVAREAEWGTILAFDPATGHIAWQRRTDRPMVGGSLVTAGGLLFTGEGTGWFRAYDAATGTPLWEYRATAGVNAPPIAFQVDGREFIAVAAGGNTQQGYKLGDAVLIFGLPAAAAHTTR
jgi:alcohol dehydrogenase (cytochrome c)